MRKIELKPCPFCGRKPEMIKIVYRPRMHYYVQCSNEDCKLFVKTINRESPEEAARAWNTRREADNDKD